LGRPAVARSVIEKAEALRAQCLSLRKVEKQLGLGEGTIRKRMKGSLQ
jgi:hypothetical protein